MIIYHILPLFITAFALSYLLIPHIIKVAHYKGLYKPPEARDAHEEETPRLGGIAIFSGLTFALLLWTPNQFFSHFQALLSAFLILFLVGVRDDIKAILPGKKLLGQLLAAAIVVFKGNVFFKSFHGVLGIEQIPLWASYAFSVFTIILLINAFNLIDGINGLAGSVATLFSISIGIWLYLAGAEIEFLLAFALAGATLGFLAYNFRSKIFMGDTGSMLLGLVSAVLLIRFLEWNETLPKGNPLHIAPAPAVAVGLLILPLFDTLRVFVLRILRGKSPLQADRTHLHHLLLDLGLNHLQATAVLILSNIGIIALCYYFQKLKSGSLILLILAIAVLLSWFLAFLHRRAKRIHD